MSGEAYAHFLQTKVRRLKQDAFKGPMKGSGMMMVLWSVGNNFDGINIVTFCGLNINWNARTPILCANSDFMCELHMCSSCVGTKLEVTNWYSSRKIWRYLSHQKSLGHVTHLLDLSWKTHWQSEWTEGRNPKLLAFSFKKRLQKDDSFTSQTLSHDYPEQGRQTSSWRLS